MVIRVFSDHIAAGVHKMQRVAIVPALILFYNIVVGVPDDHIPGIVDSVLTKDIAMAGPSANTITSQSQRGVFGRDLIADDHVLVGFLKVDTEQRIFNFVVAVGYSVREPIKFCKFFVSRGCGRV